MFALLAFVAAGTFVRGARGNSTSLVVDHNPVSDTGQCDKCNEVNLCPSGGQPGTATCLPVVCRAVCECRQGLLEPPAAPPIAILPPPTPEWDQPSTEQFCACTAFRALTKCQTDLCKEKILQAMEIVGCKTQVRNAQGIGQNR